MSNRKIKERSIQFCLLGLPIIAIIATLVYVKFIADKSTKAGNKSSQSQVNPFSYDISDLKKVNSELVKYVERGGGVKVPLRRPTAMTIASDNTIYVAGKDRVLQLDLRGQQLQEFAVLGIPISVDIAKNGDMAVCFEEGLMLLDKNNQKIFDVRKFPKNTLFTSVAIEGDSIYVTDAGRRVLIQLNRSGEIVNEIGKRDSDAGIQGFIVPSADFDVIPGNDETVWVVNPGIHQLENYTYDGKLRSSWSAEHVGIQGFSGCCNPTRILLLENGDFVTAEKHIVRVKIYSPTGEFKCVVAAPHKFEDGTVIIDIASDRAGNIYILDSKSEDIRVFEPKMDRDEKK